MKDTLQFNFYSGHHCRKRAGWSWSYSCSRSAVIFGSIIFSFILDDLELWDISLETTDLNKLMCHKAAGSPAAQQPPETPHGRHQMTTRNRTPQRMHYHKPPVRFAQLQPSAALTSNSHGANQRTPGMCYEKWLSSFCLNSSSWLWKLRSQIINLEREKRPSFAWSAAIAAKDNSFQPTVFSGKS